MKKQENLEEQKQKSSLRRDILLIVFSVIFAACTSLIVRVGENLVKQLSALNTSIVKFEEHLKTTDFQLQALQNEFQEKEKREKERERDFNKLSETVGIINERVRIVNKYTYLK